MHARRRLARVHFGVLGPLRVTADDGSDVTPKSVQQRRVLARLVVSAPKPVSVATLEDLIWSGQPPSANALQAIVSKLRKIVAPAQIVADAGGYALTGEVDTDLAALQRHLDADQHADVERLMRGEPLHDLADDLGTAAERARLAGMVRAAQHNRLRAGVRGASPLDAIAELESLVIADSHDERWWALLMEAQHRCGMQAEALRTFQRARQVLGDELGLEPGPELRRLEQEVLAGAAAYVVEPAPRQGAPRIPARLASFVGRGQDLIALAEAVETHRLVTLLGPGGTGKTTTALELVRRAAIDAAAFVALSPVSDLDAIVRAFVRAIGLPDAESAAPGRPGLADEPLDRVIAAVGSSSMTLIVDNCEHVIDDIASVVHRLLIECPNLRVIATSRSVLSVPGEHVYALAPLDQSEAVELFVARAGDHAAQDALSEVSREALVSLCERLDRLPLAIELAAARLRSMSLDELSARLDDRFAVLNSGPRTVEPRQQTLRAVVDWSYELLDPAEQLVFRRISVFVGGASAEAVEFVAAGDLEAALPTSEVVPIVDRLIDKSLLLAVRMPEGTRYVMLQTLHDYAEQRLAESGEREAVLMRHAQYYAYLIAGASKGVVGQQQMQWLNLIRRERDNLDAARATAIARQDAQLALELVTPLGWYFYMTNEMESGAEAMADALGCPGPTEPALRALALALYGWLVSNGSNLDHALASTSEAMTLLDRIDDAFARGLVVGVHTMSLLFAGRMEQVATMVPLLERLAEDPADPWAAAITKVVQGELLQFGGKMDDAERVLVRAAEELERVGDHFGYALTMGEVAEIAEMFGDYDRAAEYLQRAIDIAQAVGFSANPLAMRARLGNVEILRGNLDVAERNHRALLDDPVASAVPWLRAISLVGLSNVARRRGEYALSDELLRQAWSMPRSKSVPFMRSIVLVNRGYLADQQHDHVAAIDHQRLALETAVTLDNPRVLAFSFEGCAGALAIEPSGVGAELGARLLGAADQMRRGFGGPMPPGERFDVDRAEQRLRATLGDHAFEDAFAAGAEGDTEALAQLVVELNVDA
jgi:predicted ATPase/DNA-binding SARP family transcriptional activator